MDNRDLWRATRVEEIIDPARPIIDPHHHLWPGTEHYQEGPYRLAQIRADVESGHRIVATVYVDAHANYGESGPAEFRPVAETAYAAAEGEEADRLGLAARICAGIVSNIDLSLPNAEHVLDAHIVAAKGRMRGVRQLACSDPTFIKRGDPDPLVYDQPSFRRGFPLLAARRLTFDSCLFHYQIPQLIRLARDFPETTIVLDHLGSPLAIGPYAGMQADALREWRPLLREISHCPNVVVKLGGQGMYLAGYSFHEAAEPPSSDDLVAAWGPLIEEAIQLFGPERSMFESNFPVDGLSCSYPVLWNAFKKMAAGYSPTEQHAMFYGTANRTYRMGL